jgi:hypothetical protein
MDRAHAGSVMIYKVKGVEKGYRVAFSSGGVIIHTKQFSFSKYGTPEAVKEIAERYRREESDNLGLTISKPNMIGQ